MKARTRSRKLLNGSICTKNLVGKYGSYLSKSPISVCIYASMIIEFMGNEHKAICIWFLNLNVNSLLIKMLLRKR